MLLAQGEPHLEEREEVVQIKEELEEVVESKEGLKEVESKEGLVEEDYSLKERKKFTPTSLFHHHSGLVTLWMYGDNDVMMIENYLVGTLIMYLSTL